MRPRAETSVFAVTDLEIAGGSPRVQAEVRRALAPELGRSLLRVSGGEIDRRAAAVPDVVSLTFDRRFPHTLRVRVDARARPSSCCAEGTRPGSSRRAGG